MFLEESAWWFIGGMAAAIVGRGIVTNDKVQDGAYKGAVACTTAGIQVRDRVLETAQNIKDGANDIYEEASEEVKQRNLAAQKRAEIERRVREKVELEIAEEEAALAAAAD
ncbi:MAG: hypothetical protein Q4A93_04240 [Actinomycetota bacterium]|jgi:hypothetical protein|nr:hypothetical protein [Actinomycetota bacterium]